MLLFTPEQQSAVNFWRAQFNAQQTALAKGLDGASVGSEFIGNAAPIGLEAWRRVDAESVKIQRDALVVFNRLAAASSQAVSLGDLVSYFPQVSDNGGTHWSMDGRSQGSSDQSQVNYVGTPVPILVLDPVRMGFRQMAVNAKGGSLEMDSVSNMLRKGAEALEDMAINGVASINVKGAQIYGLRNFPQRKTTTHSLASLRTASGTQWIETIRATLEKNNEQKAYGRATLFVNYDDWFYAENTEFAAGYPKTIAQRVRENGYVAEIVASTRIPANEIIAVNELGSGRFGKVLNAMPLMTRPKARHNPEDDYVIGGMASAAVQFKSDANGNSQIAHMSKA
jgi:hypothetical protein